MVLKIMHKLETIVHSLDKTLGNLNIADYSTWEKVGSVLSKYFDSADSDWEIVSVSEKKVIIETNMVQAYLYQYDTDLILKNLENEGLNIDSIVFKVKKSTII